jgi:phosphoglycolate phosphatase-like HAD superfamily hydrolase
LQRRLVVKVLLFDIDGTLVLTGGAGMRAMTRAYHELFGVTDALSGVPLAGRTDAWILSQVALAHGFGSRASDLQRFRDTYLDYLPVELQKDHPRKMVMPGVRPLLDVLTTRADVHVALLTGNYERGARAKLEYFDLWRYFRGGAFGDEALDRNSLVDQALLSIAACGGPAASAAETIIIGDTPLDVACAASSGARSIAVATGSYSPAALQAAGADVVFDDLSETADVLSEIDRLAAGVILR